LTFTSLPSVLFFCFILFVTPELFFLTLST
jgi:hypothetical protein